MKKQKFSDKAGDNDLEFYKVLVQVWFTTNKRNLICSKKIFVYELPHKLPNELRLKISENWGLSGKSQYWVQPGPSTQSPFEKSNFGNSCQKLR